MEKDSTLVTPSMREFHYEAFGVHSNDDVILAWHNSQLKEHPTSKAYQEAVKTPTEQMKAEYDANPEKWAVYQRYAENPKWRSCKNNQNWNEILDYKLIQKENKHKAAARRHKQDVGVE